MGDINLHHPTWGGPGTKINNQAIELLKSIDHYEIKLAIEKELVT